MVMGKMLTIKEIARALGLDHSSVSRILNGRSETHKYNPETVERVKAYARERGFRKNSLAAGLKSGRAGLIGATFPDIGNPFFGKLAALIDKELEKHGFRMILANSGSSPEKEAENIESFISHRVDGVIYSPSSPGRFTPPDEITVPIVTVDCPLDAGLSHAGMDNQATFGELARRIREKG
jgi:LacI family transcriptional regulator